MIILENQFPEDRIRSFETCNNTEKCLKRLILDDGLAVATSRRHCESLSIRRDIYCFDTSQSIRNYLKTFLIRRDFDRQNEFNNAVEQVMEAGLIAKWEKDYTLKREIDKNNMEVESVHMGDTYGPWMILGTLFSFSSLVAAIEQIIFRKAHNKNSKSIWKWMSMMIDGDRHFLLYENLYGSRSILWK